MYSIGLNSDRTEILLRGKRIFLRPLTVSGVTQEYVDWLNDPEVNQFLESRFERQTMESVIQYVQRIEEDDRVSFLAIIRKDDNKHIGNIKSGPIDQHHRRSDIGFIIGDKSSWGKGYATEAIGIFSDYLLNTRKLHKIIAGAYENNVGSIKALQNNGYRQEAKLKQHAMFNGAFIDVIQLAKINNNPIFE